MTGLEVALAVLLTAAVAAAAWLGMRFLLLKRALRRVDSELRGIVAQLEDNRILKLPQPDADLEALLGTVNGALDGIRQQAVQHARREAELKAQVERISHDLRTPLTSICGYLALVDEAALDAETREALVIVRRKAGSLQRLVAQFYDLSRLRGDDVRLELAAVDAGRLVREAVTEHYRLLAERGLDVRVAVPERSVCVQADAEALERVLENLLHNAGKYATGTLEVTVAECEGGVTVSCANDATPLSTSEVARLFDPFYTVDAARSQESSGLGLSIARLLVERMGGTLEASGENRDGVFWLRFDVQLRAAR